MRITGLDLFDNERVVGVKKLTSTNVERPQPGEIAMRHVMVITPTHLDKGERPVRYKVENSWGDGSSDKGFRYVVMTDGWFDE
jgi:bleomycin hydrolase